MDQFPVNKQSEQLLLSVKTGQPTVFISRQLANLSLPQLQENLPDDNTKKAFWINCYNACFLILRKELKLQKPSIFRDKHISIAQNRFSLDDIEHGILRKCRYKYSLGYLPNIFARAVVKKLTVDHLDYRIHFALNCGAKSCPPIAFYSPDKIDAQLEMATLSFLESETDIETDKKKVHVSKLLLWYRGDFGGAAGIRKMLTEKLQTDLSSFQLKYKEYSWDEHLDNFA